MNEEQKAIELISIFTNINAISKKSIEYIPFNVARKQAIKAVDLIIRELKLIKNQKRIEFYIKVRESLISLNNKPDIIDEPECISTNITI